MIIDIHPAVIESWIARPPRSVNITRELGLPDYGRLSGGPGLNQLTWSPSEAKTPTFYGIDPPPYLERHLPNGLT
jgi:hypothetical protein